MFELAKEPVSYSGGDMFDEVPAETKNFTPISYSGGNLFDKVHTVVNSETPLRPDRLGRHNGNKPQDLLRQREEEKKKIF